MGLPRTWLPGGFKLWFIWPLYDFARPLGGATARDFVVVDCNCFLGSQVKTSYRGIERGWVSRLDVCVFCGEYG